MGFFCIFIAELKPYENSMKTTFIFLLSMITTLCGAAQEPIKVACIGNSITYGACLDDREHDAYPAQLQRMLGNSYEVGNFGKSGATLLLRGHRPYMQQEEYRQAVNFNPDIAVIHLGINDTDPRDWPNYRDDFVGDYLTLIDSLRASNPKMRVLVARLTPIGDRHPRFISGTKMWLEDIQQVIPLVARLAGAELIDFHQPLYAYPFLLPDALHPNPEGAGLLAKTVFSAITGDYGGLQVSPLYTDNMVLQHGKPLTIKGVANSGEQVTVRIAKQQATAVADNQGKWAIHLQPLEVGEDYQLRIETKTKKLCFHHVAVGEVWLCSGQSNMQFQLKQAATAKQDIPQAADDGLRFFDWKARWLTSGTAWPTSALDSINHLHYYKETTWQKSSPSTAESFSAVAYYFGRMLRDSLQMPIGLIHNSVGGSPIEAWIDRNTLESHFPAILKDWMHNDFIQEWVRGRAVVNLGEESSKNRHPYEPCYLYECGIDPLDQFPIQGVIWYQGESNAHNFEAHEELFKLMVNSWRENWKDEKLPFYFVQLSSLNRPSWPWFRDSQRRLMQEIPHTGMVVSTDVGDSLDVHPVQKKEVGDRLARWALQQTYHHTLIPSGPLFRSVQADGDRLIVSFDYAKGLQSADGKQIVGFEVASEEGLFYPATAVVDNDRIRLSSEKVKRPRYVRYAWQPFTRANLINGVRLPASTFRGSAW